MQFLAYTLGLLNAVPQDVWALVIQVIISAIVVSPAALGLIKWWSVDSEKKKLAIVMLGSLASAAIAYLMSVPEFAPWFIIVQGWLTFATTQPVYMYLVKPLVRAISAWFEQQVAQAALRNEAHAAVVPATGLPLDAVASTHEDFSK